MECKDVRERFSAYIEGFSPPHEAGEIEHHLASCRECREAGEELRRTIRLLAALPDVEAPPWLKQKIMTRIRDEAEAKPGLMKRIFHPLRIKVPIQVFATVLIAVTVMYVYTGVKREAKILQPPAGPVQVAPPDEPIGLQAEKLRTTIPAKEKNPPQDQAPARRLDSHPTAVPAEKEKAVVRPIPPPTSLEKREALPAEEVLPTRSSGNVRADGDLSAAPRPAKGGPGADGRLGSTGKDQGRPLARQPVATEKAAPVPRYEPIRITLFTRNSETGAEEAESLISALGAEKVQRETVQGGHRIHALIPSGRLPDLYRALQSLGETRGHEPPFQSSSGQVSISVEILPRR